MKNISIRDMVLLNLFFGALLILLSAVYVWGSFSSAEFADAHVGKPQLTPNAVYEQGRCDKLKEVAVSCYKSQDELFVTSLRANARNSKETAWILSGLGVLLFLNAWAFRTLAKGHEQSRSNK